MIDEAVILAGGFGSRLKDVVADVPKPMAPVRNRPFLEYQLNHLIDSGISHIILSTGFKSEIIENYFGNKYMSLNISYSVEDTPLGTGGAILMASKQVAGESFFVLNGDTLFYADLKQMESFHSMNNADITIAARLVDDSSRYGNLIIDSSGRVSEFVEKKDAANKGLVNGGIYLISKKALDNFQTKNVFSFENDLLATGTSVLKIFALGSEGYFIDIGTPGDYLKAQNEL